MPFLEPNTSKLEPAYRDVFTAWKRQPDKRRTDQLLRTIEPEIRKGISAHIGQSNPLIYSHARRLAVKSMSGYDPQQSKLGTYLVNQLQGLKRINRQQTQVLRVPERIMLERGQLDRAETELGEQLGRDPSINELADYTSLSPRRINYVRRFQQPLSEGYFASLETDNETSEFSPAVNQTDSSAWEELVYSDLNPIDQKVMEWTLGMHGKQLSNQEIARRLRISPGAVSQRKLKIQQLLNQRDEVGIF